ncbi:unnamed protein product [Rhizoctonia solani]|uniref:Uncharacterized protein n=1 Tax=Rhizoctonia solani TaxID=456999 RepID=A0A8H3HWW6_9AGAM|nr:unnamed protein product [Rhizoctonia solani]
MFFTRFVITALSFSAAALAAPIGVPGVALPVDGLLPIGSGSSLPIDVGKLPLDTTKLPLPIDGGSVPSLGGGAGGIGLPLAPRHDSTYSSAVGNLGGVAGGFLGGLNGAKGLDAPSLLSGITNLNCALGEVIGVLKPLQGLGLDSLLAGGSLGDITKKTQSAFQTVNGVLTTVKSLPLTAECEDALLTTMKSLTEIESCLGIAPELQSLVKGILAGVLGLVGGLLGGLGLGL